MRKAFTLIELMIVIAIIAIIAAIAIPNLLESRITANEAAAATSLKSGVFPSQTQYQAGSYIDVEGDGRGAYAVHVACLAGATGAGTARGQAPTKALSLLDPKFNVVGGQTGNSAFTGTVSTGAVSATTSSARVGSFDYALVLDLAANTAGTTDHDDNAESYWGGVACPKDTTGNEGRRGFGINAAGTIYQSKQTVAQSNTTIAKLVFAGGNSLFGNDPTLNVATVDTNYATPYQK